MSFQVYLGTIPVGVLESHKSRLAFRYHQSVGEAGGPALSVRLPARLEPYGHDEAASFFANLLPEEEFRRLVARVVGQSDRNVAGLLGAIGGECAGAVSIWPAGEAPSPIPEYVPLDAGAVRRLFEAGNVQGRLAVVREARLSIAGGMEKLGLRRMRGGWYRSRRGAPTTHILKWPPSAFPDLPYNEFFCLALWRAVGLPVPEAEVEGAGTPVLVVRRYDRLELPDGGVRLIHQGDFAQATGTEPGGKYQSDGGPGFAACAAVLQEHASVPARERGLLLRWAIANFLTGNEDAHAKNLALLHGSDGTRLAPFYDVVCTDVYPGLRRRMAMAYGGEYRPGYVHTRHWERFAGDLGVPPRLVRSEALSLADAFENALPGVGAQAVARHGKRPIHSLIEVTVTRQIRRVRTQLRVTKE